MQLLQRSPSSLGKSKNKNSHQSQITIFRSQLQRFFAQHAEAPYTKENIIYQKKDMNLGMNKKLDK